METRVKIEEGKEQKSAPNSTRRKTVEMSMQQIEPIGT